MAFPSMDSESSIRVRVIQNEILLTRRSEDQGLLANDLRTNVSYL